MSKGEPAANQSFTSHIFCFPAPFFHKDLAQKGESTYLIWAIFDNLFHFTQHTVLILMLYAVSVHLASPFFSHKLPCITASYFLHRGGRQRIKKTKKKTFLKLSLSAKVSGPRTRTQQQQQQRQAGFSPLGSSRTGGGKVFTTTFQSSIDAMWCQLKVTKTLTLPYAAAAPQNHRIWLWEWNY